MKNVKTLLQINSFSYSLLCKKMLLLLRSVFLLEYMILFTSNLRFRSELKLLVFVGVNAVLVLEMLISFEVQRLSILSTSRDCLPLLRIAL